jgi:hypothetical protein
MNRWSGPSWGLYTKDRVEGVRPGAAGTGPSRQLQQRFISSLALTRKWSLSGEHAKRRLKESKTDERYGSGDDGRPASGGKGGTAEKGATASLEKW